ncbi:MAG: DUF2273 domain-containing protein [Christensenellaceae bacterium]
MKEFLRACAPYMGRIVCCFLGVLAAVLWMLLGFWRTLLLALLALGGYFIGLSIDNREKFRTIIGKIKLIFERE